MLLLKNGSTLLLEGQLSVLIWCVPRVLLQPQLYPLSPPHTKLQSDCSTHSSLSARLPLTSRPVHVSLTWLACLLQEAFPELSPIREQAGDSSCVSTPPVPTPIWDLSHCIPVVFTCFPHQTGSSLGQETCSTLYCIPASNKGYAIEQVTRNMLDELVSGTESEKKKQKYIMLSLSHPFHLQNTCRYQTLVQTSI